MSVESYCAVPTEAASAVDGSSPGNAASAGVTPTARTAISPIARRAANREREGFDTVSLHPVSDHWLGAIHGDQFKDPRVVAPST